MALPLRVTQYLPPGWILSAQDSRAGSCGGGEGVSLGQTPGSPTSRAVKRTSWKPEWSSFRLK